MLIDVHRAQTNALSPFFIRMKFPFKNASHHSFLSSSSKVFSVVSHILSQSPVASHDFNLVQQVEYAPNWLGRSFQRLPVLRMYRMPSSVLRSLARGRPVDFAGGITGSMNCHCLSVSSPPPFRSTARSRPIDFAGGIAGSMSCHCLSVSSPPPFCSTARSRRLQILNL